MDAWAPLWQHHARRYDSVEPTGTALPNCNSSAALPAPETGSNPPSSPGCFVPGCEGTPAAAHQSPGCFPEQVRGQRVCTAGGLQASGETLHGTAARGIAYRSQAHRVAQGSPLLSRVTAAQKGEKRGKKRKKILTIGKICSNSPAGALPPLLQEIPVRVLQRKTTRRNT